MTTLTRMALDTSTRFAALSPVTLEEACRRLRDAFDVPPFTVDVESAGDDRWEYATTRGETVAFNLTRLVRYSNPARWTWMRGAPDDANYQVVLSWASEAKDGDAMHNDIAKAARALECDLRPYR